MPWCIKTRPAPVDDRMDVEAALKKAVAIPKKRGRKPGRPPAAPKAAGITIVTPTGYRIENISPKDLLRVLM